MNSDFAEEKRRFWFQELLRKGPLAEPHIDRLLAVQFEASKTAPV
jgi:hypothetical protein